MSESSRLPPSDTLAAWSLTPSACIPITVGNINLTFEVEHAGRRAILQRLNPIFSPEVHHDIAFVTEHLHREGLETPRLLPTHEGQLWHTDGDGYAWRLQTYMDGVNRSCLTASPLARSAGRLVGKFHSVLAKLTYVFKSQRLGVHDTPRHLFNLRAALKEYKHHTAYDEVVPMAEEILETCEALPPLGQLPKRIVHGDLKINNIMFTAGGEASCLIDLDTLGRMSVAVEMGDAFRSWCNQGGEDTTEARFEMSFFEAGMRGYLETIGDGVSTEELTMIPAGVQTITLELAARYCADVLRESYFAWDCDKYDAAWQHNLLRARGQLNLARDFAEHRMRAEALVGELMGAG